MATLLFGIAGAAVGAQLGSASIGWAVGTLLAGALFPARGQAQDRNKIEDLRLSGSSYGAMIPQVYAHGRVGGNIIWFPKLIETSHKTRVGGGLKKGGPTVREYEYFANMAVLVCEGPIPGIRRIWADDLVIYDTTRTPSTTYTVRIYLGSEDQDADDLILAEEGADETPAYRGYAYVVFEGLPLSQFGNRVPVMTFEVACSGAGSIYQDTSGLVLYYPFDEDTSRNLDYLDDHGPFGFHLTYPWQDTNPTGIETDLQRILPGARGSDYALKVNFANTGNLSFRNTAANPVAKILASRILPGGDAAAMDAEEVSVEIWVRFGGISPAPAPQGGGILFFHYLAGASGSRVIFRWDIQSTFTFGVATSTPNLLGEGSNSFYGGYVVGEVGWNPELEVNFETRKFQQFVFTFKPGPSGRARLYYQGQKVLETVQNRTTLKGEGTIADPGGGYKTVHFSTADLFNYDEVVVFNRELTPEEVLAHYKAVKGIT